MTLCPTRSAAEERSLKRGLLPPHGRIRRGSEASVGSWVSLLVALPLELRIGTLDLQPAAFSPGGELGSRPGWGGGLRRMCGPCRWQEPGRNPCERVRTENELG